MERLRKQAREALKGNWGTAIMAIMVAGFITEGFNLFGQIVVAISPELTSISGITSLAGLFLAPAQVGLSRFFLDLHEHKKVGLDRVFYGFENGRYGRNLATLLIMTIFLILWTLLLIIPGIIKSYAYALVPYLLAEEKYDQVSSGDVLKMSERLMDGHKGELFGIQLYYTWWFYFAMFIAVFTIIEDRSMDVAITILSVSVAVYIFYTQPLLQQVTAAFYKDRTTPKVRKAPVAMEHEPFHYESTPKPQETDPLDWKDLTYESDLDNESSEKDEKDDDGPFFY